MEELTLNERGKLIQVLESRFPWLGKSEEVSGADVIEELNQLYVDLLITGKTLVNNETLWGKK